MIEVMLYLAGVVTGWLLRDGLRGSRVEQQYEKPINLPSWRCQYCGAEEGELHRETCVHASSGVTHKYPY